MRVSPRVSRLAEPRSVAVAVGVAIVGVGAGLVASGSVDGVLIAPFVGLGVLGAGLAVSLPALLPALALPATLLLARVGGILSVSDFALAAATLCGLLIVRRGDFLPMRALLWAGVVYLATALPTVVLNPYAANAVEWVHEVVLIIGSLIVGLAVGRSGYARFSVSVYVVACVVIGVVAVMVGVGMMAGGTGFGPVYLPGLHKNTIGGSLAVALVLLYAKPVWFRWRRPWTGLAMIACVAGLAASGSRQGVVGALVGLLVVALRRDPDSGRLRLVPWLVTIPAVIVVATLVDDQLGEGDRFNSAYQRLDWYTQSFDIWQTSPVFGVGLRWWYLPQYPDFQPPNAELEVLSSTGIVGLIGFLAMFLVAGVALWRLDPAYGTAAAAVVATRFTQAQFDLYWVAGQASALWIVAGIAYGAYVRARPSDAAGAEPGAARPLPQDAIRAAGYPGPAHRPRETT